MKKQLKAFIVRKFVTSTNKSFTSRDVACDFLYGQYKAFPTPTEEKAIASYSRKCAVILKDLINHNTNLQAVNGRGRYKLNT